MRTTKPICSKEWFWIDWTDALANNGVNTESATIDTVIWAVDGLTVVEELTLGMITYIKLSGGTAGVLGSAECTVTVTADDITLCETIYIDLI